VNIFVLDRDPRRAARYHCDRHVVKMVLESAQLLSTGLWIVDAARALSLQQRGQLYRPTHRRHPCTLWAAESLANYRWLTRLAGALVEEYHYRYGERTHASELVIDCCRRFAFSRAAGRLQHWASRQRTPFPLAMPDKYRCADPVEAYRRYYLGDKALICTWTRRRIPAWFTAGLPRSGAVPAN
jgi:hypothetical protein